MGCVGNQFYINPGDELCLVHQLESLVNPPDAVTGSQSHFDPARVWIKETLITQSLQGIGRVAK
jgi:hypothetical protein